jgi:hypothetical protein
MASQTVHPEVLWAQRSSTDDPTRNIVYLTITAPDVPKSELKLDVQDDKLTFTGKSDSAKSTYHVEIPFYAAIDGKETKVNHTGRDVELVLRKKELGEEYWPRLLKDKAKVHWLRTDFDKWVDEDEQDPNADDDDYMARMGGLGGAGGGAEGFEGIDFSKFGSGPGGEPPAEIPEDSDDEEDDEDEDMPALEGEDKPAADGAKKSGIEEIE